jgi:uncharacterized protein YyaL (SSP411 family)
LAGAAEVFRDARYAKAGMALRGFLTTRLWNGQRLVRARSSAGPVGNAALEDYAYVARGLADWARYAGPREDLILASRLVDDAWRRFYVDGAWRDSDELLLRSQALTSAAEDGPMPSATAVLIGLSLELAAELSLPELETRARQALERSYAATLAQPFWYASHAILLVSTPQAR